MHRHTDLLRQVAHELSPDPERKDRPKSATEAHERLTQCLQRIHAAAPRSGLGAATGAFVDHVMGVAERYGSDLCTCFDDNCIPATTNELEGFFGTAKRLLRRAMGTGKTSGTVVQNLGEEYLMALAYASSHGPPAILGSVGESSWQDHKKARDEIADAERGSTLRRSRRRAPNRHMNELLAQWRGS